MPCFFKACFIDTLGPDLTDIHTPRERLHIASTERTCRLLLGTLKRLDA